MKVLAFGIVKDMFNNSTTEVNIAGEVTVDKLKNYLEEKYPGLGKLGSYMIAVNNEYVSGKSIITEGDEVAIIPPVSGG